jgi:NAD(P)-dependent dehydrogenase (short-subunit alcohol dehydrogenase family)
VAALTANLADELGPHGIGVTVVHPGLVETERTPQMLAERMAATGRSEEQVRAGLGAGSSLGRLVTAAEVADVVVFLASPRAVAVSGDAVGAGGGNRGVAHY